MTVQDFIEKYKTIPNFKFIKTEYIPYAIKMAEAREIVNRTMYIETDEKKKFWYNTPMQYHLFIQRLIANYTDIEIQDPVEDYDTLNKEGLIEAIISAIPRSEYKEFDTVLRMTRDDEIANTRDLTSWLENKFDAASLLISSVLEDERVQAKLTELSEAINDK